MNRKLDLDPALFRAAPTASERPAVRRLRRFLRALRSRYLFVSLVYVACGLLVLSTTAGIQLAPSAGIEVGILRGVAREQVIPAPRGEIVDRYGVPLAYNEAYTTLSLCHAGLANEDLNRVLLRIALLLESRGESYDNDLGRYLAVSPVRFATGEDDVFLWQQDANLLNLDPAPAGVVPDAAERRYVKTDAGMLFAYLRDTLFQVDPSLEEEDAFRVMRLRWRIFRESWAYRSGRPLEFAPDVGVRTVVDVEERNDLYKGILVTTRYRRRYTGEAAWAGHVVGYIGAISASQYDEWKGVGYLPTDLVGQVGVEAFAERYLKGQDGLRPYNIMTGQEDQGVFLSLDAGRAPVPGGRAILTLDMRLQKVAMDSMARTIEAILLKQDPKSKGDADSGALVMMDVRDGAILALLSYPGFSPDDFVRAASDPDAYTRMMKALGDTKDKPLLNRAIMENYTPGSTFKPLTAVAALETGAVTARQVIRDTGTIDIGGWIFRCLEYPTRGHGNLSLTRAMATSCNVYFHQAGFLAKIDNIDRWGREFGLGELSGIDLPGEVRGVRASRETKKRLRASPYDQVWFPADTAQTAIGQFDNSFTILQLARYAAGLATGRLVTPHVLSGIEAADGTRIRTGGGPSIPIPVQESTLAAIRTAMVAVAADREGTAHETFLDFPIPVACKTGTAETGFEDISSSNALFICYAPADNPQVAIAQIVEKGVWGSNTAGIARDLLEAYFGLEGEPAG